MDQVSLKHVIFEYDILMIIAVKFVKQRGIRYGEES